MPVHNPHRRAILMALLVYGALFSNIFPDKPVDHWTLGRQDPRGRIAAFELRTGGFEISFFHRWTPPGSEKIGPSVGGFALQYETHIGVPPWENRLAVGVPWWFIVALLVAKPLLNLAARDAARAVRQDKIRQGLCPICGYDLRATPDRCPECGKTRDPSYYRT